MLEIFSQRLVSHVADAIAINNASQQEFVRSLVLGANQVEDDLEGVQPFVPSQEEVVGGSSVGDPSTQVVESDTVSSPRLDDDSKMETS